MQDIIHIILQNIKFLMQRRGSMIGHTGVFTVFKYTERLKLTFDASFECPNLSYSYYKKLLKKKSHCTIYVSIYPVHSRYGHFYVDSNDNHILVMIMA